jgi:hypothetical protein
MFNYKIDKIIIQLFNNINKNIKYKPIFLIALINLDHPIVLALILVLKLNCLYGIHIFIALQQKI